MEFGDLNELFYERLNEEQKLKVEEKVSEILDSKMPLSININELNELKEKVAKSMYRILNG